MLANRPAPSYFSRFFENQLQQNGDSLRTLYIDRDPETFREIALHLQGVCTFVLIYPGFLKLINRTGYHIEPRDNSEFIKLFADAQFYSCISIPIPCMPCEANSDQR